MLRQLLGKGTECERRGGGGGSWWVEMLTLLSSCIEVSGDPGP
jgi:hypothetical protein